MAEGLRAESKILRLRRMRRLFKSEQKAVSNLMRDQWQTPLDSEPKVCAEHYSNVGSASKHSFNADFLLKFADRHVTEFEYVCGMSSILPNTLGAEVFLTVEKTIYRPLMLELIGGEAFPIGYFGRYIRDVEAMLHHLAVSAGRQTLTQSDSSDSIEAGVRLDGSLRKLSFKQAAYSRILVVGSDICFLVCPDATSPVMRGVRHTLVCSPRCEIDCFLSGSEISCLDGWVSAEVPTSEYKLVATWGPCAGPPNLE
ncbi:hypothetical protein ACFL5Q_07435 [Planctomycetota bacterium]